MLSRLYPLDGSLLPSELQFGPLLLGLDPFDVDVAQRQLVEEPEGHVAAEQTLAAPGPRREWDLPHALLVHVVEVEPDLLRLVDLDILRELVQALEGNLSRAEDVVLEGLNAGLVGRAVQVHILDCEDAVVRVYEVLVADGGAEQAATLAPVLVDAHPDRPLVLLNDVVHLHAQFFALVVRQKL